MCSLPPASTHARNGMTHREYILMSLRRMKYVPLSLMSQFY